MARSLHSPPGPTHQRLNLRLQCFDKRTRSAPWESIATMHDARHAAHPKAFFKGHDAQTLRTKLALDQVPGQPTKAHAAEHRFPLRAHITEGEGALAQRAFYRRVGQPYLHVLGQFLAGVTPHLLREAVGNIGHQQQLKGWQWERPLLRHNEAVEGEQKVGVQLIESLAGTTETLHMHLQASHGAKVGEGLHRLHDGVHRNETIEHKNNPRLPSFPEPGRSTFKLGGVLQYLPRFAHQQLAFLGQRRPVPTPIEEREAQRLLQGPHGITQRRSRTAELLGRRCEAPMTFDGVQNS